MMLFDRTGPGCDYEEIHFLQDPPSGLRAILAVHSSRLGPSFGGIRRRRYASEEDAVRDALRLACSMSRKCALAGVPAGGAKTVILDHPGMDRAAAYRAIGRHVSNLRGRYVCGPDVGTTEDDLDAVREETEWVNPKGNDAGRSTAQGVLAGLRGTLQVLDGDPSFEGRVFLVQGLGAVGSRVATALMEGGGTVLASEVDDEMREKAKAAGLVAVPPEAAVTTACDVLVPCALGDIFSKETAKRVHARAVCGSANDQLASPDAGRILHERGVLYAPDFVVNSGAVVEGFYTIHDGTSETVRRRVFDEIEKIAPLVQEILDQSRDLDVPPAEVAVEMADRRIARVIEKKVEEEAS